MTDAVDEPGRPPETGECPPGADSGVGDRYADHGDPTPGGPAAMAATTPVGGLPDA